MKLKVLLSELTLLLVLITVTFIQAKEIREELVRKHVSVSVPKRVSSVISHFTPAGHEYEAQANVLIERVKKIPKKKKKERQVKKKLATGVEVKSPVADRSESTHFDPAYHIYEASGQLLLDEKSPLLDVNGNVRKTFKNERFSLLNDISSPIGKPRTLVINSPAKKSFSSSSVINHFNPARHVFGPSIDTDFQALRTNSDTFEINDLNQLLSSSDLKPRVLKKRSAPSSEFLVQKSVSVKSPERKSTVINHFTPASHIYAATGNVVVRAPEQKTITGPITFISKPKDRIIKVSKKVSQPIQIINTNKSSSKSELIKNNVKLRPIHRFEHNSGNNDISHNEDNSFRTGNAVFVRNGAPIQHKKASFGTFVQNKVSVATPQRKSNVINHFTPANHYYNTEGNVVIKRGPSIKNTNIPLSDNIPEKTVLTTIINPIPGKFQQPSTIENNKRVISSFAPIQSSKSNRKVVSDSDLFFKKTVSAKSSNKKVKNFRNVNNAFVTPAQSAPPQKLSSSSGGKNLVKVDRTVATSSGIASKGVSRIFLEKSVSVRSPQRKSSVISHFTPATHNYAATGNVLIDRIVSAGDGKSLSTKNSPSNINTRLVFKPAAKKEINVAVDDGHSKSFTAVKNQVKETKLTQGFELPGFNEPELNFDSESGFDSDKGKNIFDDRRNIGAFDFGPAASYDLPAEFSDINSYLPPSPDVVTQRPLVILTPRRTTRPNIRRVTLPITTPRTVVQTRQRITTPRTTARPSARERNRLRLDKIVSVTSPPDTRSVISHFKPALLKYEAVGEVSIQRASETTK